MQVVSKMNWPCKAILALLPAVCLISWTQAGLSLWLLQAAVCSPLAGLQSCAAVWVAAVGGMSCFIALLYLLILQQSWEEGNTVLITEMLGCCVVLSFTLV